MTTQKLDLWQYSKTENVTSQKPKLWGNSKTQVMKELKNSNCDKTQKLKLWLSSKTPILTKLKNSNSDKTQKLKLWQNAKIQIVTTQMATKLKNIKCDKTETKIVTKLKNSNSANLISDKTLNGLFARTTWHLDNRWDVLWAAFCDLAMFLPKVQKQHLPKPSVEVGHTF